MAASERRRWPIRHLRSLPVINGGAGVATVTQAAGGAGFVCVKEPVAKPARPSVERNLVQSAVLKTFESSSTTMV